MQTPKPLLIIKTGSTFPAIRQHYGDFDAWIRRGLDTPVTIQVADTDKGDILPAPLSLSGVVITGSHAMVTESLPWMRRLGHWLREATDLVAGPPILGLCFGHQILARALGGEVADNPMGLEAGTVALRLTPAGYRDALVGSMGHHPWAQVVHRQSVLTPPPGATVLASNVHDACQAFRYGERVWGLQFHPEFSADVMRAYLQALRGNALTPGQVERQLPEVRECVDASALLGRFAGLIQRREQEAVS